MNILVLTQVIMIVRKIIQPERTRPLKNAAIVSRKFGPLLICNNYSIYPTVKKTHTVNLFPRYMFLAVGYKFVCNQH